ncbi:hypothetical protein [Paractinoplanes durhamensis]|uniref:hypothetical protein n=1 Tax=Paractinoplanes durhamensis TaxID=113563 RepID=UPI0036338945
MIETQHAVSWWDEFEQNCERFDAASVAEALSDVIVPGIPSLLLRREAEIAADTVLRHLNRPGSTELAERATMATVRLATTVARLDERVIGDESGTAAAHALVHVLQGRFAAAAAAVEPTIGTGRLLRAFVSALRLESLGTTLALRLLNAGHSPPSRCGRATRSAGTAGGRPGCRRSSASGCWPAPWTTTPSRH